MTTATREQVQIGLEDAPLNDLALEDTLEKWQEAKDELTPKRKAFASVDKTVKALIKQKELPDGTYRAGRHVIKISKAEETHIEFERSESRRISIKPAKT